MALNSAQRQAAYRARQRDSSETGRINAVVSIDAAAGLARLARWRGVTKRQMLEQLIGQADASAADESRGNYAAYYDG